MRLRLAAFALAVSACGGSGAKVDGPWVDGPSGNDAGLDVGADGAQESVGQTDGGEVGVDGAAAASRVRFIYLLPTDRTLSPEWETFLGEAARHLQLWFHTQMGNGKTFALADPVVERYATPHTAGWYKTNAAGTRSDYLRFWDNVVADGFAATGGSWADERNIWLFFIDAEPACGQIGGGGAERVVVLPSGNNVRLLRGQPGVPTCPTDPPYFIQTDHCVWVGGAGHELGHGLKLPHPPGCDDGAATCDTYALLYLGYTTYPKAHLTAADKAALDGSSFIVPMALSGSLRDCHGF